ncbi:MULTISPECIES: outer membrane protein assembly factor BamC [Roseateles]|uniref:Outer membrane protein assembly factor BamC n=1 Tax=Pelomonas caseinilytica TaxID=2906763 RepID=A0ABS8X7Q0_9BURK|nr:outer membrane protein assembly factor BamC [Roseateles sp.]MCE4536629.1 outer membrane protein assembly factor BamC [Pelomonas sp. P7]HEV6965805.1 outer membrane protein assembly factor BamC [Roseateles sp.]
MTSLPSIRPTATCLACSALVLSLTGCSTFDNMFSSDKVDYKTASRQTQGLDVPPDLTQLAKDSRAQVQGGSITASALTAARPATTSGAQGLPAGSVASNAAGDVRLERSGTDRWLHTSATPEQLWPQIRSFWQERGLEVVKEQPEVGVMETNWAENRAKLPQDIIRSTIGKVFDGLYSTGERDMYRTRVERGANGTDIFISHRGMQEVYTTQGRDSTAWQNRPSDPYLEAEMLSRLMLKLGGKEDAAKAVVAEAGKPAPAPSASTLKIGGDEPRARRPLSEVPDSLSVNEGFDRAWRRVGLSLDRHGFTIEDRDRAAGLFYLRYADPEKAGQDEPNFFQRLFGAKAVTPVRYRVSVKAEGDKSTVRVLDDRGQAIADDNAKRILSLLMDDLK